MPRGLLDLETWSPTIFFLMGLCAFLVLSLQLHHQYPHGPLSHLISLPPMDSLVSYGQWWARSRAQLIQ